MTHARAHRGGWGRVGVGVMRKREKQPEKPFRSLAGKRLGRRWVVWLGETKQDGGKGQQCGGKREEEETRQKPKPENGEGKEGGGGGGGRPANPGWRHICVCSLAIILRGNQPPGWSRERGTPLPPPHPATTRDLVQILTWDTTQECPREPVWPSGNGAARYVDSGGFES